MKLYSEHNDYKLYEGNMLDLLQVVEESSVDSIVTDPPYELGFMGKSWDNSGIAFQKETWEQCYKALKPGGHLLAFGGTRTYHRIACAIEDAGFEIRDCIMWLYGSGFPKSMNIGLAIDKRNGVESPVVGQNQDILKKQAKDLREGHRTIVDSLDGGAPERNNGFKTVSADIRQAQNEWEGWGTQLKPSYEPIIIARKPVEGSIIENVMKWNVGGYNIDECRVPLESNYEFKTTNRKSRADDNVFDNSNCGFDSENNTNASASPKGRFPANVIHDGSDEALESMPTTGSGNGGKPYNYAGKEYNNKDTSMFNGDKPQANSNYNDNGSAGRYFKACEYGEKDIEPSGRFPANTILTYDETDFDEVCGNFPNSKGASSQNNYSNGHIYRGQSLNESQTSLNGFREWYNDNGSASRYFYCAKASKKDRDAGLEEMDAVAGHGKGNGLDRVCEFCGVSQLTPELCHCETKSWVAKPRKNFHPTVKPTSLMQYLVRLVTPNKGTVLDPFNGSGSTGKAVMYENLENNKGYKYIGIELTPEYLPISKARLDYVCNLPRKDKEKASLMDLLGEIE